MSDRFDMLDVKSILSWDVSEATLGRLFSVAIDDYVSRHMAHVRFSLAVRELAKQAYELGMRDGKGGGER